MTPQQEAAMRQALEALELNNNEWKSLADSGDAGNWKAEDQDHYKQTKEAITALRQALEQPAISAGPTTQAMMTVLTTEQKRALLATMPVPEPEQQEIEKLTAQRNQLADILTRTANALKGQPAELSEHSWHDLPEVAQQLKAAQQEPVCETDPRGCWSVRCQLGNVCKNTRPQAREPLTDEQKDAARWRWIAQHIQVKWDEGKFTSLVRIVSDENRQMLNASIDRMMAGDWSDAEKHNAGIEAALSIKGDA